jgi:hypothetical protein
MNTKKIIIISIVVILAVFGTFLFSANAMPDSPFFVIKRWEEKLIANFKKSPSDQITYNLNLLNTRLYELEYVTATKNYVIFYPTALRYSTAAGEITDISIAHNSQQKQQILNEFAKHQAKIKNLLSQKDNQEEWKYIRDPYNAILIYTSKLTQKPVGHML